MSDITADRWSTRYE